MEYVPSSLIYRSINCCGRLYLYVWAKAVTGKTALSSAIAISTRIRERFLMCMSTSIGRKRIYTKIM